MPLFGIRLINSEFESSDDSDYPSLEEAAKAAIMGATKVVSESITAGGQNAAVEVQIHSGDMMVARKVVTLSVADLSGAQESIIR